MNSNWGDRGSSKSPFRFLRGIVAFGGRCIGLTPCPRPAGKVGVRALLLAGTLAFVLPGEPSAAEFGDAAAAFENGEIERASSLLEELAEQGDARARSLLGVLLRWGVFMPKDTERSLRLFRQAADQGDAEAQSNLGFMFGKGHGVEIDDERSQYWFRKAAVQGHLDAQSALGLYLATIPGTKQILVIFIEFRIAGADRPSAVCIDFIHPVWGFIGVI